MGNFWNYIVQTNTFNFAIMVVIFIIIFQKTNLSLIIKKIQENVTNSIENAKKEKETADKNLKHAKKLAKNTDSEIEENLYTAKQNAKNLAAEIKKVSDEQIAKLRESIVRIITTEEKKISAKLEENTLSEALELAKNNIEEKLKHNNELHKKLIEQSIQELDKIC